MNQTNFEERLPEKYKRQAELAVKDEYLFDFIELAPEHSERELEQGLILRVQKFLSEMGGMFAFIGSQHKIIVNGDEFFIDLLLYHRKLRCMVAVELKIGKFEPTDVGQLQFYLTALDAQEKLPEEKASIGIIICRSKNRTVVEYALKSATVLMGVATYRVSNELPKEMKHLLPEPEEIARKLEELESDFK
ncbi:MAG: PDDEXK nuclease domain-containing protein [Suipraeoptans sp.]